MKTLRLLQGLNKESVMNIKGRITNGPEVVKQAEELLEALRAEDKKMMNRHIRRQRSDVVFVKTNNPDSGYLRFINTEGKTMSLSGPTIDHNTVARDEQGNLFHRIEVGFWNYDASGVHGHPASTAEEILEVLAHHLGYEVTKRPLMEYED